MKMPMRRSRWVAVIPACVLSAACADAAADRPVVERTDSAGVEIVTTMGGDRQIAWSFEPVLSLGGADEGPESFYQLYDYAVATDAAGNLYVLDMGNHRIVVFDPQGHHLRSMGRQGSGPGEFEWASGFSVTPGGLASLFNYETRSFMRWGPDGELLPSEPVEIRYQGGRVAMLEDGAPVLVADSFDANAGTTRRTLVVMREGEKVPLASFTVDQVEPRDFGCVAISAMGPLLASDLVWTVSGQRVLTSAGTAYAVDVLEGGRHVQTIRRPVPPREVTGEMASREVGESMKVSFGSGGGCEIPAEKVVEVRGHASHLQPVRAMAVAPDGTIWVERGRVKDEDRVIDIFDSEGVYVGSLPPGSPFPAAFTPNGDVVSIERDDLDVEHVVVYRVNRGA